MLLHCHGMVAATSEHAYAYYGKAFLFYSPANLFFCMLLLQFKV
jgi:hypothetical protein